MSLEGEGSLLSMGADDDPVPWTRCKYGTIGIEWYYGYPILCSCSTLCCVAGTEEQSDMDGPEAEEHISHPTWTDQRLICGHKN